MLLLITSWHYLVQSCMLWRVLRKLRRRNVKQDLIGYVTLLCLTDTTAVLSHHSFLIMLDDQ